MHISNDRYFLDRQRHDLALRMIRHEARTCTIRSCTGLTDDRIRRLYKTYASHARSLTVRRHRGRSPRQASFFTRNVQAQFEASLLASAYVSFGLLAGESARTMSLQRALLFCDAFETHRQLCPTALISFEHAWFLLQLVQQNALLRIVRCRHCDSQYLRHQQQPSGRTCPICKLNAPPSPSRRARGTKAQLAIASGSRIPASIAGSAPPTLSSGC
jgi:Flagellar transcriptional activator (FlhC)